MKYIAPFGKVYAKKSDKQPLSREIELKSGETIKDYMVVKESNNDSNKNQYKESISMAMPDLSSFEIEKDYTPRKGKKYE